MSGSIQDSKLWTWKLNLGWRKSHGGLKMAGKSHSSVTILAQLIAIILYKMKYWWEFYLAESCNWWIKYVPFNES